MQTPLRRRTRLLLAGAAGLLQIAVFPKLGWWWLAWVALVPLLLGVIGWTSRGGAFLAGYVAGLIFFSGTCYWIHGVMHTYGGLSWFAASLVLLAFILFFAAYFGLFALAVAHLSRHSIPVTLAVAPFVWVALEFTRAYFLTGFPWNLLGYAVIEVPGLAHVAALSGVYGASLLVAVVNSLLALALWRPSRATVGSVLLVAAVLAFAGWRKPPEEQGIARAVLVQTNLAVQTSYPADWMARHRAVLDEIETMTVAAALAGPRPELVAWPETPAPFYFRQDPQFRARAMLMAQASHGSLLLGIVDYRKDASGRDAPYNSAVLLAPSGAVEAQYDKIHLVPFGEYVPARSLLWFARKLTAEVGDFAPGDAPTVAQLDDHRLGTFICYEAIFPALVREFTARGAEVLVNLSNDSWFGRSAAPEQHLWMARMRAVENGRWLLRATNNGITCVIDPQGRMRARLRTDVRATLDARFAYRRELTPYVRLGDWLAWLAVVVVIAALFRQYWMEQMEVSPE